MKARVTTVVTFLLLFASATTISQPTWSADVAKIVYNKCTPCHRAGEIAPFSLESYSDAYLWRYAIKGVVGSEFMPPWPPAKGHGEFVGDRSLSESQKQTIAAWVDADAPVGNPELEPQKPVYPDGSQLGVPDLVLEMKQEWHVQGNQKDVYRFFVLPSGVTKDIDLAAIEFRPGNAKVVHHVLFFVDTTGVARTLDAADPLPGYSGFGDPGFETAGSYLGWVPGSTPRFFPEGIGLRLYKNADLVIQVHYAPSETDEVDKSHLNIFFHKNSDVRLIQQFALSPYDLTSGVFLIPPNQRKTFLTSFFVPLDVSIVAVAPHMHLLGTNCRAFAVKPNGDTVKLIKIDDWEFHWQGGYTYVNPVKIPFGSTLYYEAEYDNTTDNPENPNSPPQFVGWGESTTDEMLLCYFFWLPYQFGDEAIRMETTSTREETSEPYSPTLVNVSPNPAKDNSSISITSSDAGYATVRVFSSIGREVNDEAKVEWCSVGKNELPLSILNLATGVYYVTVELNSITTTTSLVVLR